MTLEAVQGLGSALRDGPAPCGVSCACLRKKKSSSHQQTFIEHHCVLAAFTGPADGGDRRRVPWGSASPAAFRGESEGGSCLWVTRPEGHKAQAGAREGAWPRDPDPEEA
ncbi:hypothetical protein H1C71_018453, partial [Ictidomys tridecemlineatus]